MLHSKYVVEIVSDVEIGIWVKKKKGGNVMENITTRVEIADHTGHTVASLTQRQTIDLISDSERWVFAGDQMVEPEQLAQADWSTVGTVRVMPRIVFG